MTIIYLLNNSDYEYTGRCQRGKKGERGDKG